MIANMKAVVFFFSLLPIIAPLLGNAEASAWPHPRLDSLENVEPVHPFELIRRQGGSAPKANDKKDDTKNDKNSRQESNGSEGDTKDLKTEDGERRDGNGSNDEDRSSKNDDNDSRSTPATTESSSSRDPKDASEAPESQPATNDDVIDNTTGGDKNENAPDSSEGALDRGTNFLNDATTGTTDDQTTPPTDNSSGSDQTGSDGEGSIGGALDAVTKPIGDTVEKVDEVTEPVEDTLEKVGETATPIVEDTTEKVDEITKPIEDTVEKVDETTKPIVDEIDTPVEVPPTGGDNNPPEGNDNDLPIDPPRGNDNDPPLDLPIDIPIGDNNPPGGNDNPPTGDNNPPEGNDNDPPIDLPIDLPVGDNNPPGGNDNDPPLDLPIDIPIGDNNPPGDNDNDPPFDLPIDIPIGDNNPPGGNDNDPPLDLPIDIPIGDNNPPGDNDNDPPLDLPIDIPIGDNNPPGDNDNNPPIGLPIGDNNPPGGNDQNPPIDLPIDIPIGDNNPPGGNDQNPPIGLPIGDNNPPGGNDQNPPIDLPIGDKNPPVGNDNPIPDKPIDLPDDKNPIDIPIGNPTDKPTDTKKPGDNVVIPITDGTDTTQPTGTATGNPVTDALTNFPSLVSDIPSTDVPKVVDSAKSDLTDLPIIATPTETPTESNLLTAPTAAANTTDTEDTYVIETKVKETKTTSPPKPQSSMWFGTQLVVTTEPTATNSAAPKVNPSNLPQVIASESGLERCPESNTLCHIAFDKNLPWEKVVRNSYLPPQILYFLPIGLSSALKCDVQILKLTSLDLGNKNYTATRANFCVPSGKVGELSDQLVYPRSALYSTKYEQEGVNDLLLYIDVSYPLVGDNGSQQNKAGSGSYSGDTGNTPGWLNNGDRIVNGQGLDANSKSNVLDGSPISPSKEPFTGRALAIGVCSVSAAAIYGVGMILLARRYRRNRNQHQRAGSLGSGGIDPPPMAQNPNVVSPLLGGIATGAPPSGDGDKRGSKGSKTSARGQISAPMMSENSLGWN